MRGALGSPIGAPPPVPVAARPASKAGGRLLLVLGDSLARGTGDESGRGFALDVQDAMKKHGATEIANLSVNGAESPELRELCSSANVRSLAASADVIVVSIGGNDLSHAIPRGPAPGAQSLEDVTAARTRYAENLHAIVGDLRRASPLSRILLLELYDPFGNTEQKSRLGAEVILRWNDVVAETALTTPNAVGVPTFDLFEGRPDRLSGDRFHPNRNGYAAIATRMVQVLPDTP